MFVTCVRGQLIALYRCVARSVVREVGGVEIGCFRLLMQAAFFKSAILALEMNEFI